jgi:hypothetical protein
MGTVCSVVVSITGSMTAVQDSGYSSFDVWGETQDFETQDGREEP